jgi:methionyl aminopeptidase
MSIESDADWTGLQAAAHVVRLTLNTMERSVGVGVTTATLDAVAANIFRQNGARSAPALEYGFPGTVLISVNDEVVHGIPGQRQLAPGDVVKLDVTVEKDGYIADAARTVIVGRGSETAGRLATCAKAAFTAGLRAARAGHRVNEIGRAVEKQARALGFTVLRGLAGHGVGRAIHEPPTIANYYDPWQTDVLSEGLVVTIEPLITAGSDHLYQDADGWTIRTRDGAIAAHHEHTIVVTGGEPIVLTAGSSGQNRTPLPHPWSSL